jgi:hypothetical protein
MSKATATALDEVTEFGPAMLAICDRWRTFVMHFVVCGVGAEAIRRAGFGTATSTPDNDANQAYRLLGDARIQAAVAEETTRWYRIAAAKAVREVHRILDDPKAKDADKLRAADGIIARLDPIVTGMAVRVEHEHTHRIDHGKAAVESLRWMKSMGVSREKLLEYFGHSGLSRYERMLHEENEKAPRKSAVIDVTPPHGAERRAPFHRCGQVWVRRTPPCSLCKLDRRFTMRSSRLLMACAKSR